MEFLTIKEAAEATGKGESTIKRFVRETKKNNPNKYSNNRCFKFEKLPTGHKKILISKSFLSETYSIVEKVNVNSSNKPLNEPLVSTENQELIAYLKKELEQRDKQLEQKDKQLEQKDKQIEQLIESTNKIGTLVDQGQKLQAIFQQKVIEQDTTKKRWWQRRK